MSEQSFEFKGLKNKAMGLVLRREFRKQTERHVENFKRFAEREITSSD